MQSISLFSGIAGMDKNLPFETVLYVEKNEFCQKILNKRMLDGSLHKAPIHNDIKTLENVPNVDIICGGFPCQDISIIGGKSGLNNERSGLFHDIMRIVNISNPKYIYLENVSHILNMPNVWKSVLKSIHNAGYDCTWTILSASHMGAPHLRKRFFLLAKKVRDKNEDKLNLKGKRMYKDGFLINGEYSETYGHNLPYIKLLKPLLLKKLDGIKCKGKVVDKDYYLFRWATPRLLPIKSCKNLTKRSKDDLPSQVRFEVNTNPRLRIVNPNFVEWLMGFPQNWTNPDSLSSDVLSWKNEPKMNRMVPDGVPYIKERLQSLGNACVPACSQKAYEVLFRRFKKRKRN